MEADFVCHNGARGHDERETRVYGQMIQCIKHNIIYTLALRGDGVTVTAFVIYILWKHFRRPYRRFNNEDIHCAPEQLKGKMVANEYEYKL